MRWLLFIFLPILSWAHPVIFKGGTELASMTMADMTQASVLYSVTSKWSFGAEYWRLQDPSKQEQQWQLARLNHLAYRHNGDHSQSNIYLMAGLGRSTTDTQDNRLGWSGGVEADWETREYYLSGKYLHLGSSFSDADVWVGRVGYSPYKAPFDQLQSWVMLQAWHDPITSRETKITPLLRFFYHNVLWEVGASTKGEMFFNWMIHI